MQFFPRTIEKNNSDFNGEVKVVQFLNQTAIWSGGFEQSGPLVAGLWKRASDQYPGDPRQVREILILGLGGGAAVKILRQKFPQALITGVEIDPLMIVLGRK